MHEATYVVDKSLRRQAMWEWWWSEDAWMLAFPVVLVITLLVMVFSDSLRLPAAVLFGVALAWFIGLVQSLVLATRRHDLREQTVRFTESAFETASSLGEASRPWSAVSRVILTRHFVFLTVGDLLATVPRSAFSDDAVDFAVEAARGSGAKVHGRTR